MWSRLWAWKRAGEKNEQRSTVRLAEEQEGRRSRIPTGSVVSYTGVERHDRTTFFFAFPTSRHSTYYTAGGANCLFQHGLHLFHHSGDGRRREINCDESQDAAWICQVQPSLFGYTVHHVGHPSALQSRERLAAAGQAGSHGPGGIIDVFPCKPRGMIWGS